MNRTTRTGYVLGPAQRVEPIVALKALTLWGAYQHFEEKSKGSIEVGKLADFVILPDNPITMERSKLSTLKVLETIKEGRTIWRLDAAKKSASCIDSPECAERYQRYITATNVRMQLIALRTERDAAKGESP